MNPLVLAGLLGGVGGFVRGVVGVLKSLSKKKKIVWRYWLITVIIAVIIGILAGVVFGSNPKLSLLAGYAGTDLLEGIAKSTKLNKVYSVCG